MKRVSIFLCEIFFGTTLFLCDVWAEVVMLCPKDSYVQRCGSKTVGTYWLKGYVDNEGTVVCPDYYDYEERNNMKNLRIFFHPDNFNGGEIIYTQNSGNGVVGGHVSANSSIFSEHREAMLSAVCNPNTTEIVCAECPYDGKTDNSSTVIMGEDGTFSQWKIFTFADCYIRTFSDSTGTYAYYSEETGNQQLCHYSNEIKGNAVYNGNTHGYYYSNIIYEEDAR